MPFSRSFPWRGEGHPPPHSTGAPSSAPTVPRYGSRFLAYSHSLTGRPQENFNKSIPRFTHKHLSVALTCHCAKSDSCAAALWKMSPKGTVSI